MLFCEECGQSLQGAATVTLPTRKIGETPPPYGHATWGTARFDENSWIVLHVRDAPQPIVVRPDRQIILGRYDANNAIHPDVDLEAFGALDKGVSRIHASITRNDDTLVLTDLRSANGTLLNGQRLIPEQPRVLRDGDEIRLGKLVLHIYFRGRSEF